MTQMSKTRPVTNWADGTRWTPEELTDWICHSFAIKMYEFDGWDFLVECHEESEVLAVISKSRGRTRFGAVQACKVAFALALHDEQRQAVLNEVF